jgi:hypothetical protein
MHGDLTRWLALAGSPTLTEDGRCMFADMARKELDRRAPVPAPGQSGYGSRLLDAHYSKGTTHGRT